jgi:hypothetical protein
MQFTEEQLKMAERYGAACRELKFLAKAIEVDFASLKREYNRPGSELAKRYDKGFELTMIELLEAAKKQALRGSNPALNMLIEMAKAAQMSNL